MFIVAEGEFLTVISATAGWLARGVLAAGQRQMTCIRDPKRRLVAACELVKGKIGTLALEPAARRAFTGKLAKARSIEVAGAAAATLQGSVCALRNAKGALVQNPIEMEGRGRPTARGVRALYGVLPACGHLLSCRGRQEADRTRAAR